MGGRHADVRAGGRRMSDPVYHHAEVYGNKAERRELAGTGPVQRSSTGPGPPEASGHGTRCQHDCAVNAKDNKHNNK